MSFYAARKINTSSTNAEGSAAYLVGHSGRSGDTEKPTLGVQSPGVWIYVTEGTERLVPVEDTLVFTEQKQVKQALNDVFAKAYFGCKVWESELTAKPMPGTGFLNYITPEGKEVFFPISWCFEECPPAFFLVAEKTPEELGIDVSYVNIYTSLAESENTGLVDAYFRIYADEDPREDVTQKAQLVSYSDERVTVTPETVNSETSELKVTITSLTTQPSGSETHGLANLIPPRVGFFELASGQVMCRDEAKWDIKQARRTHDKAGEAATVQEILVRLCGLLPPAFVPVEIAGIFKKKGGSSEDLKQYKIEPPALGEGLTRSPSQTIQEIQDDTKPLIDTDGNPVTLDTLQPRSYVIPLLDAY